VELLVVLIPVESVLADIVNGCADTQG
jgi:hypothetical protein